MALILIALFGHGPEGVSGHWAVFALFYMTAVLR